MTPFDRSCMYDFLLVVTSHCKYSCLASFSSYLTLNNIETLKLGLQVTEDH